MLSRIARLLRPSPSAKATRPVADSHPSLIAPPNTQFIKTPNELLQPRHEFITRIEESAGTTRQHFVNYYLPVLQSFAGWVQECPASEAHHHAHAGGLLDHALEVASIALKIRLGYLLPPGAPPEEIPKRQDIWTYAVFTAALMHDVAKPAVDLKVTVFDREGQTWRWNPWLGSLGDHPDARWYHVEFIHPRQYRLHEKASLLLAHRMIPAEGLAWLTEDREAFSSWLACINGDSFESGVLGEILTRADSHSVARNLGAESGTRLVKSAGIPLHEKLITGLRYLIDQGELPLNRNGAAGWRIDDDLWLVSKRVADTLRTHLTLSGHSGIPSKNDRLFDLLQEHGLLHVQQDRAIWRATVEGDGWSHRLTLLRIPIIKIWPDLKGSPDKFVGQLIPDSEAESIESLPETPILPEDSVSGSEDSIIPTLASPILGTAGPSFLDWLRSSLAAGHLDYNQAGARIHVVEEGVLLVSPGIFQDYVQRESQNGEPSWEKVQKNFLKQNLHCRTPENLNIHRYRVVGSDSVISGLLIAKADLFSSLPDRNQALERAPLA